MACGVANRGGKQRLGLRIAGGFRRTGLVLHQQRRASRPTFTKDMGCLICFDEQTGQFAGNT